MPLVPAKCTQCGANLEVDSEKECAICTACGTPFITEKAIVNYVTHNTYTTNVTNTTNVNAEVVHIHEDELNKLFLIENGVLTRYNGALTEIVIPEGVTALGKELFLDKDVDKVTLAKSVVRLMESSLSGVKEIVIPEGSMLRQIDDWACCAEYGSPYDVKAVFLPKTVEKISEKAFWKYTLLCYEGSEAEFKQKFPTLYEARKGITPDGENGYAFYREILCGATGEGEADGFLYAENADGVLVYAVKNVGETFRFPTTLNGKRVLGYTRDVVAAAVGWGVKELYLPEGLKTIPNRFFQTVDYAYSLYITPQKVHFPASVESVGERFFGGDQDEDKIGVFASRPNIEKSWNKFKRQYSETAVEKCGTEIEIVNLTKKKVVLYGHPKKGGYYSTEAYVIEPKSTFKKRFIFEQISLGEYPKNGEGRALPQVLPSYGFYRQEISGEPLSLVVGKTLLFGFYATVKQ